MSKIKIVKENGQKSSCQKGDLHKISPGIVAQALVVLAVLGTILFCIPNLPSKPTADATVGYQGVINLWLVDTFEGGSGSRQNWFTKRAAYFEQQHNGMFVCVTALTETQLAEKLSQGQNFDMLCFSRGVGATVLDKLAPLNVDFGSLFDNFAQSGRVGATTYALPVYTGAYCLFARKSQQQGDIVANSLTTTYTRKIGKNVVTLSPLVCGFTSYNSPLTALAMANVNGDFQPDYTKTQYVAYQQFVDNKTAVTLFGTQRDMYRLGKKLETGKIDDLLFAPLCAYTDLVTYVGISRDTQNLQPCVQFAKYLISDVVQQTVADVSMFSVTNQNLYTKQWYDLCQQQLPTAYVPNVFGDSSAIENSRNTALKTLSQK